MQLDSVLLLRIYNVDLRVSFDFALAFWKVGWTSLVVELDAEPTDVYTSINSEQVGETLLWHQDIVIVLLDFALWA